MRDHEQQPDSTKPIDDLSRREFMAAAAGLVAAAGAAAAAAPRMVEHDVEINTADGLCNAAFMHPAEGAHPGVLIWTDVFGLRPVFRAFGRRVAALGYSVLVPNPFYRFTHAQVIADPSTFDFKDPSERAKLERWTGPLFAAGAVERDAGAYLAFLDAASAVDTNTKIGTHGYCMGGPLALRTAAHAPNRVGAGASFHGGDLVTDKPDSPHKLAPKIKARMYFAIAASDDERQPQAKDELREAFAAAHVPAQIEVYPGTVHGWCVPDMPRHDGVPIYDEAAAERAFGHLVALYRSALV